MTLPSPLDIRQHFDVYPTQPMISAACLIQVFGCIEDAARTTKHGCCEAETHTDLPGAGGQASKAVQCLYGFRRHGDIDRVITDLHAGWRGTVGEGNFDDRFEPGQEKAEAMEPLLRPALEAWFKATPHKHQWADGYFHSEYASPPEEASRRCPCGRKQVRVRNAETGRLRWQEAQ